MTSAATFLPAKLTCAASGDFHTDLKSGAADNTATAASVAGSVVIRRALHDGFRATLVSVISTSA